METLSPSELEHVMLVLDEINYVQYLEMRNQIQTKADQRDTTQTES